MALPAKDDELLLDTDDTDDNVLRLLGLLTELGLDTELLEELDRLLGDEAELLLELLRLLWDDGDEADDAELTLVVERLLRLLFVELELFTLLRLLKLLGDEGVEMLDGLLSDSG